MSYEFLSFSAIPEKTLYSSVCVHERKTRKNVSIERAQQTKN